jgi:hypothetical protein
MNTANNDEKKRILDGLIELFGHHRRWLLFFGTGTSCALDQRFGMPALQAHLSAELTGDPDWAKVEAELGAGKTLEAALTGVGVSPGTKAKFRQVTGEFVAGIDREFRDDLLLGKREWVGARLMKTLVGRLPARNPRLSVITSNYDMLIEYACSFLRIRCTTGFAGGLTRGWNWKAVQDGLNQCRVSREGSRGMVLTSPLPRVELFKVHGSINRFTMVNQQIECDLWTNGPPSGLERDVAVPGDLKYEQYAINNMDTVSHAMRVENEASAFAMMGYGFNDPHLHQRIMSRVQTQDCPLVVLTMDLAPSEIATVRGMGSRVWFLVAPRVSGGGNDLSKTVVYMPGEPDGLVLDGEDLWNCDSFAEKILGG